MKYLLDTCVISEFVSRRPNPQVIVWLDQIPESRLFLSVVTLGEIRKGVVRLPASERKDQLAEWLAEELPFRFDSRILPVDAEVMQAWGDLAGSCEAKGQPMPDLDAIIAATAACHHMTLVTRNEADFQHAGIPILNPWKSSH